jgi:hypothetical protein
MTNTSKIDRKFTWLGIERANLTNARYIFLGHIIFLMKSAFAKNTIYYTLCVWIQNAFSRLKITDAFMV